MNLTARRCWRWSMAFPPGVAIDVALIDAELQRRQGGYGRGGRQRIETDRVEVLTGIWKGVSLGSPIALQVVNRDYKLERMEDLTRPRPGHGDLAGPSSSWADSRCAGAGECPRNGRACGGRRLAKQLLQIFGMRAMGYVVELGGIRIDPPECSWDERLQRRAESAIYSLDPRRDAEVTALIDDTGKAGDTLGGVVEVCVEGVPLRLGHARAVGSETGRASGASRDGRAGHQGGGDWTGLRGRATRRVHKCTIPSSLMRTRWTARRWDTCARPINAGGLEAGMTNGQPLVIRAAMKPISTLAQAAGVD